MPPRPSRLRLSDLDFDVLGFIFAHVSADERFRLALVCKAFAAALRPPSAAYEDVVISAGGVQALAAVCLWRAPRHLHMPAWVPPASPSWAVALHAGAPLFTRLALTIQANPHADAGWNTAVAVQHALALLLGSATRARLLPQQQGGGVGGDDAALPVVAPPTPGAEPRPSRAAHRVARFA
jgi:hypothetical protein